MRPCQITFFVASKNMDRKCAKDIHQDIIMQVKNNINRSLRTFFNHPHKTRDPKNIFSIILQEPMVPNFLMGYNEGGISFIYLLRDTNPNLLLHPTVDIIISSTVEINFTWINLTRSRGAHFLPNDTLSKSKNNTI